MITYYTEYPFGEFRAKNDVEALKNDALVIYRESIGIEKSGVMQILRDDYETLSDERKRAMIDLLD